MDIKSILFIVILIIFLYFILNYVYSYTGVTTSIVSGTTMQTIEASKLSNSSNFTYSIWFYINDWNYHYGEQKILFGRGDNSKDGIVNPCPIVTFGEIENNLQVALAVFGDGNKTSTHTCNIFNVPIQSWCIY